MTARAIIECEPNATVLDVADRIDAAPADADLVLSVPAGAPFGRNAVFLDVARKRAGTRKIALVSADARARAVASGAGVPAYPTIAALERGELDPTERLGQRRRYDPAAAARRKRAIRRAGALVAALFVLSALVTALVVPEATVIIAPAAFVTGPLEFDVRAGAGMSVPARSLVATVNVTVGGAATGSRVDATKATGSVRLSNQTTADIAIPKGTTLRTPEGIRFVTTEDKTLPRSFIIILTVLAGTVDISIEAVDPGPQANVGAARIVVSPSASYVVSNPAPTAGGDSKTIPVVKQEDYDLGAKRIPPALQEAGEKQLTTWRGTPPAGTTVAPGVIVRISAQTPATDVVGKEVATFDIAGSAVATAFAVPSDQPRAAVLARLQDASKPENEIDMDGAVVELGEPAVTESGVVWHVKARTTEHARVDRATIAARVAGREPEEVPTLLDPRRIRVVSVEARPVWWPRMPLLEQRINVVVGSAVSVAP
ncbi:MAG: baseplate J/gp47 family protein [Candidatus Limnocylindria bacterium]